MRSAAAYVAEHVPQVDVIDLNMGCPVPKVCKTGAGAAMLKDPDTAVAVARAAREGSGKPVTVKLRSGSVPGDTTSGIHLAHRLVEEAGVAAITFHPRSAKVHHKGTPDYDLAAAAGRVAPGAGDPYGRPAHRRGRPPRLRAHRRRRGHARPRLARQPVAVRAAARPAEPTSPPRRRSLPSGTGSWTAPRSTSDPTARAATCASSTPGTSSASAAEGPAHGPAADVEHRRGARRPGRLQAAAGRLADGWKPRRQDLPASLYCRARWARRTP